MQISFTKISDERHSVAILRTDGSSDCVELDSRSFLRHDLAHLAVEIEVPIRTGYWGSVGSGAPLGGDVDGAEIELAERLSGPVQTLMRTEAPVERYLYVLRELAPELASEDLAGRMWERVRQYRGHWQATPYREHMDLEWPD